MDMYMYIDIMNWRARTNGANEKQSLTTVYGGRINNVGTRHWIWHIKQFTWFTTTLHDKHQSTLSGSCLNIKTVFSSMGIFTIRIRMSWNRLMFIMAIPILVRRHHDFETGPSFFMISTIFYGCALQANNKVAEITLFPLYLNRNQKIVNITVTSWRLKGNSVVCSIVCSGVHQRKYQSSTLLDYVRGIPNNQWIPLTKSQ